MSRPDPTDVPTTRSHRHAAFPPLASRRGRVLLTGGVVAALGLGALVPMVTASSAKEKHKLSRGFEAGVAGWVGAGAGVQLTTDAEAHRGSSAARLTSTAGGKVALRDRPNLVRRTVDGRYVASVWVKAVRPGMTAVLRVREFERTAGGTRAVDLTRTRTRLTDVRWHRLVVRVSPAAGHTLGIAVLGLGLRPSQSMLVDDVAVRRAANRTGGGNGTTSSTANKTMFGVTYWPRNGESNDQALKRSDSTLGRSHVVRIFYPGLPVSWPGAAGRPNRPVVVSFKAKPQDVLAGKHDAQLRKWFRDAPKNRLIMWSYFHEPEDNIEHGEFTAAQYRAAWKRLNGFAEAADNDRLRATLILMDWSLRKGSGRNWRDYYPGTDIIDILGWDAYNEGSMTNKPVDKRSYYPPAQIYSTAVAVSKAEGKPFGFAEWGSLLIPGDDGTARAAWIRASTKYMAAHGALFATYFDTPVGRGDWRLLDQPSQAAVRSSITGNG